MTIASGSGGALTHCRNDLCLKTILARKSSCKVANAPLSIPSHIRDLSDVVEHVATGKEEDGDQADGRPQVAVLDDWQQIWIADTEERYASKHSSRHCYYTDPVYWALYWRMRSVLEVPAQPSMDLLSCLRAAGVSTDSKCLIVLLTRS